MKYSAYDDMLRSALRQPSYGRIVTVIAICFGVTVVLTPLFLSLLGQFAPELSAINITESGLEIGTTQGGLLSVLASFSLLLGATLLCAKRVAHRTMRDLTGPAHRLRTDLKLTFKWLAGLTVIMMIVPSPNSAVELVPHLPLSVWLAWLPIGLLGLAIQVTAEEVFFRGYLQTQLVAATRSYSKGMVLAAILFGIGHISTDLSGLSAVFPVLWAIFFGLLAGDLTARSGTLGPAIAMHFINNMLAMFIAPAQGQLSGFGLWTRQVDLNAAYADPFTVCSEGLILLITWLTVRIALKR
jgi:membrane protease YdiL (CAAX protease family)